MKHYNFTLKHDTETYSFIGVDACLEPGPRRPFNFIGVLKEDDIETLLKMKQSAIKPHVF